MADPVFPWVDLSAYGARLMAFRLPDGQSSFVLSGFPPGSREWTIAQKEFGFMESASRRTLCLSFGPDDRKNLQLSRFLTVFAKAKSMMVKASDVVVDRSVQVDYGTAIPVGMNRFGEVVEQTEAGRFVRLANGHVIRPIKGEDPSRYLRARLAEGLPYGPDLAGCAEGFVRQMEAGQVMRVDDLRQFGATVLGQRNPLLNTHPQLRVIQEAIEAAMVRKTFELSQQQLGVDLYDAVVRIEERQPPLVFRSSNSIVNQQFSTPLPMAVVAQQYLGDVTGKIILEPTIGNASLVSSLLHRGAARVVGIEIDPERVAQAQQIDGLEVHQGDFLEWAVERAELVDMVIANPPFGGLDKRVKVHGAAGDFPVTRLDHLIALRALEKRTDAGKGVFIVGGDRDGIFKGKEGEISGGSRNFFNFLTDHYEVEDAFEMGKHLYEKQGAAYPIRMIVVGRRRTAEEAIEVARQEQHRMPATLPVIRSWEELRSRAFPSNVLQLDRALNDFQAPYQPLSKLGEPTSMIPRNLEAATAKALANLEVRVGDIDSYVMQHLDMNEDEFRSAFSPEQVDAVGMSIARMEDGRGIIIGDMTGQGKGRIVAGAMRYALSAGRPVIFMTEKKDLFTDIWRDLGDIHSTDMIRPFILNADGLVKDQDNNILLHPTDRAETKGMIENNLSPFKAGYNVMLCTYSQFNRKDPKGDWLATCAEEALMILDESHNAAGESNTASNVAYAVSQSWATIYSSATYAKNANNMAAYRKVFPRSVDLETLAETLRNGGEPFLEIVSSMLAEDGVLIRREHDMAGLAFTQVEDQKYLARNQEVSDKLAEVLNFLGMYGGDVNHAIGGYNKSLEKALKDLPEGMKRGKRIGAESIAFGSRLYNVMRQFMMIIKTDLIVDDAIKLVEEGKKPVITFENTMESVLRESLLQQSMEGEEGAADQDNTLLKGSEVIRMPMFADVLRGVFRKMHTVTVRNQYGDVHQVAVETLAEDKAAAVRLASAEAQLEQLLDSFPDLPASPLDILHSKLVDKGLTVSEISGRKMVLEPTSDGKEMIVRARTDDRTGEIWKFNNGESDVMKLSRSGSTGISLHASSKFRDQRPRVLMELQIANNVAERMQFFGRVNRRGQVCNPTIRSYSTGLPSEARTLAMQASKMRKLTANTSSNRDSDVVRDANEVDFLNHVGEKVAIDFLKNDPAKARSLDIDISSEAIKEHMGSEFYINRLMSRLCMLPVKEQERIFSEIANMYSARLAELDEMGINPFRPAEFEWQAEIISRVPFQLAVGESSADSVFDAPMFVTELRYEEEVNPIRSEHIETLLAKHQRQEEADPRAGQLLDIIDQAFRENMAHYVGDDKRHPTIDAALEEPRSRDGEAANLVQELQDRLEWIIASWQQLQPGSWVHVQRGFEPLFGMITGLTLPDEGKERLFGQYDVELAVPGRSKPAYVTLNTLYDKGFTPESMPLDWKAEFDEHPAGRIVRTQVVLEGNLFRAMEFATSQGDIGFNGVYTDAGGARRRAVILRKDANMDFLNALPMRLGQQIVHELSDMKPARPLYLQAGIGEVTGTLSLQNDYLSLHLPGTKKALAPLLEHPTAQQHLPMHGTRGKMTCTVQGEEARHNMIRILEEVGVKFSVPRDLYEATIRPWREAGEEHAAEQTHVQQSERMAG